VAADTRNVNLSDLAVTSPARSLRVARAVYWTPATGSGAGVQKTLTRVNHEALEAYNPNYANVASGSLTKWFNPSGNTSKIGFYLPPSVAGAIIVPGYAYPETITDSDDVTWLSDGWGDALKYYIAGMLALKSMSDDENAVKESRLLQEWNARRLVMLSEQDPAQAKKYLNRDPALEIGWKLIDAKVGI
jgi:hypothetical protein